MKVRTDEFAHIMATEYASRDGIKGSDGSKDVTETPSSTPKSSGFNQLAIALQRMNAKKAEQGGSDASEAA
ncbi:MAG: hypothetical protein HYT42_01955 [Candidatus Sungbacteria bacterium]|nr:hypothetical protein [Candidatus Sungbacteria bacterium]